MTAALGRRRCRRFGCWWHRWAVAVFPSAISKTINSTILLHDVLLLFLLLVLEPLLCHIVRVVVGHGVGYWQVSTGAMLLLCVVLLVMRIAADANALLTHNYLCVRLM